MKLASVVILLLLTTSVAQAARPKQGGQLGGTTSSAHFAHPQPGEQMGEIEIPSIGLKLPLVESTNSIEPGDYPTHYKWSALPGRNNGVVATIAIDGHHLTHALPGAAGGPFLHIDELRPGAAIYVKVFAKFGGATQLYRESGQRVFQCGDTLWDIDNCPNAAAGFTGLQQPKLILTTCIGNGNERRFVYAFPSRGRTSGSTP
jgi:hypothetical protein